MFKNSIRIKSKDLTKVIEKIEGLGFSVDEDVHLKTITTNHLYICIQFNEMSFQFKINGLTTGRLWNTKISFKKLKVLGIAGDSIILFLKKGQLWIHSNGLEHYVAGVEKHNDTSSTKIEVTHMLDYESLTKILTATSANFEVIEESPKIVALKSLDSAIQGWCNDRYILCFTVFKHPFIGNFSSTYTLDKLKIATKLLGTNICVGSEKDKRILSNGQCEVIWTEAITNEPIEHPEDILTDLDEKPRAIISVANFDLIHPIESLAKNAKIYSKWDGTLSHKIYNHYRNGRLSFKISKNSGHGILSTGDIKLQFTCDKQSRNCYFEISLKAFHQCAKKLKGQITLKIYDNKILIFDKNRYFVIPTFYENKFLLKTKTINPLTRKLGGLYA